MPENLWPIEFGVLPERTPVAILREQARGLGERTANIVVGHVQSNSEGPSIFTHSLSIYSAPLGYTAPFLMIKHGIDLYPVQIIVYTDANSQSFAAANSDEFAQRLKEIFSLERTKKTVASIIAQSKE
jgi:hypothetical protein